MKAAPAHDYTVKVPAGTYFKDDRAALEYAKARPCSVCGLHFDAGLHWMPPPTLKIGDSSLPEEDEPDTIKFVYKGLT